MADCLSREDTTNATKMRQQKCRVAVGMISRQTAEIGAGIVMSFYSSTLSEAVETIHGRFKSSVSWTCKVSVEMPHGSRA